VFEALWTNFTIFERAAGRRALIGVRVLNVNDPAATEAADVLGLGAV